MRFIDAWAIDHQAVDPSLFAPLREHYSDAQLTEVFWAVAIIFASARVGSAMGVPAFMSR